jgi:hypothetical protein
VKLFYRNITAFLLALIIFALSSAELFHHHSCSTNTLKTDSSHCYICIVIKTFSSAGISFYKIAYVKFNSPQYIYLNDISFSLTNHYYSFCNKAPPVL